MTNGKDISVLKAYNLNVRGRELSDSICFGGMRMMCECGTICSFYPAFDKALTMLKKEAYRTWFPGKEHGTKAFVFTCPHCGERYIATFTVTKMKGLRKYYDRIRGHITYAKFNPDVPVAGELELGYYTFYEAVNNFTIETLEELMRDGCFVKDEPWTKSWVEVAIREHYEEVAKRKTEKRMAKAEKRQERFEIFAECYETFMIIVFWGFVLTLVGAIIYGSIIEPLITLL